MTKVNILGLCELKLLKPINWIPDLLLSLVIGAVVNEVGPVDGVDEVGSVPFCEPELPFNPLKCFSFWINIHYKYLWKK